MPRFRGRPAGTGDDDELWDTPVAKLGDAPGSSFTDLFKKVLPLSNPAGTLFLPPPSPVLFSGLLARSPTAGTV